MECVRRTVVRATVLSLLIGAPVELRAQDVERASLEDLLNIRITTASLTSEGVGEAPARVQVVTGAQIRRRGYRSLADLLKDLADFKVDVGGDQDNPTEVTVQGMRGSSRIVLLLDGVRISSPTNEPLPILANYPVHTAKQIEIVYGPASALYGADAFSAVINIISRDAADAPGLSIGAAVGQFGLTNQTASYAKQLGQNTSLTIAGQFLYDRQPDLSRYYPEDFGGLVGQHTGVFNTIFGPMSPGRPVSGEYHIPISAHSIQATFRSGGLRLMLFENHAHTPTTPAYTPDNGVYSPDAFNLNKLVVGAASYTRPFGGMTSTSTFTVSRHELDPQSGYMNVYSNMKKSYKYAYGSLLKAEQQLSWRPAPALNITAGGTVERFFAIPQGADLNEPVQSRQQPGTILDTNITDEFVKLRYTNTGLFGQVQYAITPRFSVTMGARADHNTRYDSTFNPRVGAVARPTDTTTLKVMYGSAHLAPSPYQSASHYGSFYTTDGGQTYASSFWHVGNPDLKPQLKKTIEVNVLQALSRNFQLSASGFYSRFARTVQESDPDVAGPGLYRGWPVDYIDFPVNEGRATTYGGNLALDFLHVFDSEHSIETRAALSVADGRVWVQDEGGTGLPIGLMTPVQLKFGADVEWGRWVFAPRAVMIGTQRFRAVTEESPSKRHTLNGYATVDLTVRRLALFKNIDLFAMVENAFDRRYRTINQRAFSNPEELIGAPQNPRRVSVGFDLRLK
jgi:outer membrane cobalamin receptor